MTGTLTGPRRPAARARAAIAACALLAMPTLLAACSMDVLTIAPRVTLEKTAAILPFPRFGMGDATPGGMPEEEVQCRRRLKRLGVEFTDIPAIRDGVSCGIDWPVEVSHFTGRVEVVPKAKLTCAMAEAMSLWTRQELQPAARLRYLSPVVKIRQMSSYSCRSIRGTGTISEHAKGNALDIGALLLANGRTVVVARPGFFSFREKGFLNSIRANACDHFSTILGPGSDADHKDHFHFDIKERRGNRKHCD